MAINQNSPLLGLPAELRVQIYQHLLVQDTPIQISKPGLCIGSLNIFSVCRQTKNEAEPVFWSENTFHAIAKDGNLEGIIDWLIDIGVSNASQIRKLLIEYMHSLPMQCEFSTRLLGRERLIDFGRIEGEVRGHTVTFLLRDRDRLRDLVRGIRSMFAAGLRRPSLLVVPPGTGLWPILPLSQDTECILTAMHLAFNEKVEQLNQATNFDEEEADVVMELDGWKVRMIC